MSEENNNLEDKTNEAFENAKETAKETFEDVKETAKETFDDAKEKVGEFADEAKKSANEFTESLKEVTSNGENKKVIAGVLAIILGGFGIHKFVLGYNKEGIILLVATLITCGIGGIVTSIVGLVEGITYLTKSDEEFYQTYQVNQKPWF